MKVALCSYDIAWENPPLNFDFIQKNTKGLKADLLLLPEMYSTGFSMNATAIAEQPFGESYQFLLNLSKDLNLAIAATVAVRTTEGKTVNRLYWIEPNGVTLSYDKKHLFSYSGEDKNYTSGKKPLNVKYKGLDISPMICYDLRFPVWCRNQVKHNFQFFLANWPSKRIKHWEALLKARAIENLCYVAGVNRTGIDGNGLNYSKSTYLFNPTGELMKGEVFNTCIDVYKIQAEEVNAIRSKFGFLNDKDEYHLHI